MKTPPLLSVCTICGKNFTSLTDLVAHQEIMHQPQPKKYVCKICNEEFSYPAELKWHFTDTHGHKDQTWSLREQSFYKLYFVYSVTKSDKEKESIFRSIIDNGFGYDFLWFLDWRKKIYAGQIEISKGYSHVYSETERDILKVKNMLNT